MSSFQAVDDAARQANLPSWMETLVEKDLLDSYVASFIKADRELMAAREKQVSALRRVDGTSTPIAEEKFREELDRITRAGGADDDLGRAVREYAKAIAVYEAADGNRREAEAEYTRCARAHSEALRNVVAFYAKSIK